MEFSLFTLTLGSFLMALPYLSEAVSMEITMDTYGTINAPFEVACKFSSEVDTFRIIFLHGGTKTLASYSLDDSTYKIPSNSKFTLKVEPGATTKGGVLKFIYSGLACGDFTWYMCQIEDTQAKMISSRNETLKVNPKIESIDTISDPTVHQMSTFTCRGSISKEGAFTVKWYRRFFSANDLITTTEPAKVTSQTQCYRRIESSLTYNVSKADVPNLKLGCQIDAAQKVELMQNFTVKEMPTVAPPVTPAADKAPLEAGSIVGIVLGITAVIVLVVLLVWFLVIRPKRLKADGPSKDQGPEPNAKDYEVQDNILYATVDPLKKQNHKSSSSSLVDGPDTNSNSVQDTGTAARKLKSNKQNAFLPSRGDATDNMDEAYELPPPPPPPPPKPHRSPRAEETNPLHYAELELAVHKSAKRRSEYGQRPNTDYAVITRS